MKVIGITGASGSGKTTISQIISKIDGIKVLDADKMAKKLTTGESEYFVDVKMAFGDDDIILPNGNLNRAKLAQIIYNSDEKLQKLNKITFKHLVPKILNEIAEARKCNVKIIAIDAPLLFEAEIDKYCDYIITLEVSDKLKIKRMCERDNISEEIAQSRLSIQNDNDFYIKKSDYTIKNDENTTIEDLKNEMQNIINEIESADKSIKK